MNLKAKEKRKKEKVRQGRARRFRVPLPFSIFLLPSPALLPFSLFLLPFSLFLLPSPASAQAVNTRGVAQALTRQAGLEGRVLWIDGTANLDRLTSRAAVAAMLDRCRAARLNTVVVEVKPLCGQVLYHSRIAPRLTEWRGKRCPDFDLLEAMVEEGHRRGLKIHAALNVFAEGHKQFHVGPGYEHPQWQATVYDVRRQLIAANGARHPIPPVVNRGPASDEIVIYDPSYGQSRTVTPQDAVAVISGDHVAAVLDGGAVSTAGVPVPGDGHLLVGRDEGARWILKNLNVGDPVKYEATPALVPIADAVSEPVGLFVNPTNPQVFAYELSLVSEIVSNYDVDGIAFDRMRYSSLTTDFSPLSRRQFEKWLGKKMDRWPQDIYQIDPMPGRPIVRGPYFKDWLAWRAHSIKEWLEEASSLVHLRRPAARIGVYVGSWYANYFNVGVNWASDAHQPEYDWTTSNYNETGYAGLVDYVTTGCYYPLATREEARLQGTDQDATVQAAAELSCRAVADASFVYAGVYLLDYQGRPDEFAKALRAALDTSQGVMIFDLSYLEQYNWWNLLAQAFPEARRAPHDVPDLLPAIRRVRQALAGTAKP
jgi:uncharacterized lipoprotein YddW (UPF0748 family)